MIKKLPPSAPFIGAGIIWAMYAITSPFYDILHVVTAAVLSIAGFFIIRIFTKTKAASAASPDAGSPQSGDRSDSKYTQEQAILLDQQAKELRSTAEGIKDSSVLAHAMSIAKTMSKMADNVENDPADNKRVRPFTRNYIPTVIKVFATYKNLEKQDSKGLNACESMWQIEDSLKDIDAAFKKHLNSLFENDALDIKTDLQVLTQVLSDDSKNRMNFDDITDSFNK